MDRGRLTKVPLQHNDTDIMLNSGCRNWKRTTTFTAVELWPAAAAAARTAVCLSNTIVSEATSVRSTVPLTTFYSAADCGSHKGMSNAIIWFSWPPSWEKYRFFHFLLLCDFFIFPFFFFFAPQASLAISPREVMCLRAERFSTGAFRFSHVWSPIGGECRQGRLQHNQGSAIFYR